MGIELSDECLDLACSLIYRAWAEASDILKAVKQEKPNYKLEPDWDQLHEVRLTHAIGEEARKKRILQEITPHSPVDNRDRPA